MIPLLVLVVFPALMAFAAMSDLVTMTISNRVSVLLVLAFAGLTLVLGVPALTAAWHAGAAIGVLALTFGLFAAGWVGGGDAKLAAATTLWVGPSLLLDYFLYASVIGGALTGAILVGRNVPLPAFALGWRWLGRLHDKNTGVPYGIALAAAGMIIYPSTEIWQRAFG